jgi:hypothetical protein
MQSVELHASSGDGRTSTLMTSTSISQSNPNCGNFVWAVPTSAGAQPRAQIRVQQYQNAGISGLSGVFAIMSAAAAAARMEQSMLEIQLSVSHALASPSGLC